MGAGHKMDTEEEKININFNFDIDVADDGEVTIHTHGYVTVRCCDYFEQTLGYKDYESVIRTRLYEQL